MYGLPDDFDASIFVGRLLEQVSFTVNQIVLCFEEGISVTVEGAFAHFEREEAKESDIQELPVVSSTLAALVGHRVSAANGEGDGTLCLRFDNGHRFVCYDDRPNFEAYRIQIGETVIVV